MNQEDQFIKLLQDATKSLIPEKDDKRKFLIDYIKGYIRVCLAFIALSIYSKWYSNYFKITVYIIIIISLVYICISFYEYKTYDKNISVKEAEKTYELIQELVLAGEKSKIDILICLYRKHKYIDIIANDIVDTTTNQTTRIIKIKSDYYEREWTYIL